MSREIWEELKSLNVEKEVLVEMAMSLGEAKARLESIESQYFNHVIKCVVYGDSTGDLYYWEQEIANLLNIANNIKIKSGNGKLSERSYKDYFFYAWGDEVADYEGGLEYFKIKNSNRYPDFEITEDLVKKVFEVVSDLAEYFSPLFSKANNITEPKIFNKTDEYFHP